MKAKRPIAFFLALAVVLNLGLALPMTTLADDGEPPDPYKAACQTSDGITIDRSLVERRSFGEGGPSRSDVPDAVWLAYDDASKATRDGLLELADPSGDGAYGGYPFPNHYPTVTELYAWYDDLGAEYPDLVTKHHVGYSWEGRDLWILEITSDEDVQVDYKPGIMIDGAMHAREWSSTQVAAYFMWRLLTEYDTDETIFWLLNNRRVYIMPMLNPDGYIYDGDGVQPPGAWWRKNRNAGTPGPCVGVDLNRNWDYYWHLGSNDPCSAVYRGEAPFSEFEVAALRDFVIDNSIDSYQNIHSFAGTLLIPWSYPASPSPHDYWFRGMAGHMTSLTSRMGDPDWHYSYGQAYEEIGYTATGSASDWVYWATGAQALTFELETGGYQFYPPTNLIMTVNEDVDDALMYQTRVADVDLGDGAESLYPPLPYIVYGTVEDAGSPVPGVTVLVENIGTGETLSITTDMNGYYELNFGNLVEYGYDIHDFFVLTADTFSGVFLVGHDWGQRVDVDLQPLPSGSIEGTVTDATTGQPIEAAIVTLLDTPYGAITGELGHYSIEVPEGTYDVRAWAPGYREAITHDVYVPEDDIVIVDFALESALTVAVLGDYQSQLTNLLIDHDFEAEQRNWDVIDDIGDYAVVVVNQPGDPGSATFMSFLEAADDHGVGVVFTNQWTHTWNWGIRLLINHLGDPAASASTYGDGNVYYEVTEAHPIFDGWDVGDQIALITSGYMDHAWFTDYTGEIVAGIGAVNTGIRGQGVGVAEYGASTHVLLAGLGPQSYANMTHWTEDARSVFVNAVSFAAFAIDSGITGQVTDAETGEPIAGALVHVENTCDITYTDEDGNYMFYLPPDTYTLAVSKFGYEEQTAVVEVVAGEFAIQNFALTPVADTGSIEGTVTGADTGAPVVGATIALVDTGLSATTDDHGHYHLEAPGGFYDVHASHPDYHDDTAHDVEVIEGETTIVDFALEAPAEADWRWLYPASWRPDVENAVGLTSAGVWHGAMRIDLSDDIGKAITHVAYYDYDAAGNYAVGHVSPNVEGGTWGAPASPWQGSTAQYTPTGAGWVELPLLDPVLIEAPGIYWVVMELDDLGDENFPFGLIEPAVTYGDLINLANPHDPGAWARLLDYGIDFSLAVEARVAEYTPPTEYTLTIDSTEGGEVTVPGEGEFPYEAGTVVDLVAVADDHYHFVEWTGDIDEIDDPASSETTITMEGDYSITAVFDEIPPVEYTLTIGSTEGGEVTVPGEGEFPYEEGTGVDLVAVADDHYYFVEWTGDIDEIDDPASPETTITMEGDYSITAVFDEIPPVEYTLTIGSTEGGEVTVPGEGEFPYEAGTVVDLVAVADDHYQFVEWTGDIDEIDDPASSETTITMEGDYSITAVFDEIPPVEYTLTIGSTEGGEVTVPGEGEFPYEAGTVVDIVAVADDHYQFVEWTGDIDEIDDPASSETTITMEGDYSITAVFDEIPPVEYTLTIGSTEGGEVTVPGEGEFPYEEGTVVDLVAVAADHYDFVEWTGDIDEIDDPASAETTITMEGDYSITAVFESVVHHYHWGDDWEGDVYGATGDVHAVAIVGETDTEVWWYHIAGEQWYYDEYSTETELDHEAHIDNFWQPVHGLFQDHFPDVETFFFSRTAIDAGDVPEPDPASELLEAPVPDYYHYHWGDDWEGDVYGATGDVYAVAIVGETDTQVWWFHIAGEQWYYDEYSTDPEAGLPHEADAEHFWQPVKGLFEDHFAGVETFYYSRTMIEVGDVPEPDPVSTRLYYGTHYHWGDDWEGDVYGATGDVYAVAIVGETDTQVWWYHIAGDQWYYDQYSIEPGLPHEADIGDFWQPVRGLFEDHFAGVETFFFSRTAIDVDDVPEPTPVSELLLAP